MPGGTGWKRWGEPADRSGRWTIPGGVSYASVMTAIAIDLLSAALALPEGERLELASRLIASVDGKAEPGWDDAWLAELDRREAESAGGPDAGTPWSEAKARILARLPAK